MKYCTKCKKMHKDNEYLCSKCKIALKTIEDPNTPVYLLSSDGFKLDIITNTLFDNGIPCDKIHFEKGDSITSNSDYDNSEMGVLVPYSAYEDAYDICIGIGAISENEATIIQNGEIIENKVSSATENFEKLSGVKRTTIRILSALIFFLLVALAVYGTDALMALIKALFSGK